MGKSGVLEVGERVSIVDTEDGPVAVADGFGDCVVVDLLKPSRFESMGATVAVIAVLAVWLIAVMVIVAVAVFGG